MMYLIGLDSDRTFCHFAQIAQERNIDLQIINLREVVNQGDWSIDLPIHIHSWLSDGQQTFNLDPNSSYYCRLIDLSSVQTEPKLAHRWRGLMTAIVAWLEMIPGKVVNRPGFRSDNNSKPLHELCLQYYGFKVAPSITSSDPARLFEFASAQPAIVKAISGIRADSRMVEPQEFLDFSPAQGPVHLQQFIQGDDVRVHVIGDRYQAELVKCPTVDYRRDHDLSEHFPDHQLPESLAEQIVNATQAFGLTFAGWDFKRTPEGEYFCLEANPMPGYDGYDRRCDHKITDLLIDYLSDDQEASSVSMSHEILTIEECEKVYQGIADLREDWLPRGRADRLFCTLGAASYLDCGEYDDPQDSYWQKAERYNPLLWKNFGWLYARVRHYLESILNAPVSYREDAALPGFHIWLGYAIPTRSLVSLHCDLQYQHLEWNSESAIDFSKTLSFTLPIQLPESGGGLDLSDFNHLEFLSISQYNRIDWNLIPRFRSSHYHAYQIGQLMIHSGYTLHRVAPTSAAKNTDKRVTLQGHGVFVDGTWQLYW